MGSGSSAGSFDFVVIGGGPGGYVAAIRASQLGASVAVIERENMGGICLNWGCIPTKALLKSAEVKHTVEHLAEYGLSLEGTVKVDMPAIMARSRKVAKQLSGGIDHLMRKNRVTVIKGTASIGKRQRDHRMVNVEGGDSLLAKHIIIATGAHAACPPHITPDGTQILTYRDALSNERELRSVAVVGSGAIGVEFASFYRDMGATVTLIEMQDRILPVEDADISESARKQFEKRGIEILTGAAVTDIKRGRGKVTLSYEQGGKKARFDSDVALIATGITGNISGLGLEEAGVATERGHIVTDQWMATNVANIFAIGDVTGAPWLAHKASHEAVICVDRIMGREGVHPIAKGTVPGCTYCRPQIASIGLTEAAARAAGLPLKIGKFSFMANGKAIAMGEPEGMVKTIFNAETGALLGAHLIGPEVTEMIQGFVIAMKLETTEAELMETIFPHPTLSEAMHESVLDAFDKVIHQ
jgi:dihydrolipoamide dehydrogenase